MEGDEKCGWFLFRRDGRVFEELIFLRGCMKSLFGILEIMW